jgi:S1-C subfamily serine protease
MPTAKKLILTVANQILAKIHCTLSHMIDKTLPLTQKATVCIIVPHRDPRYQGFPTPFGTGFFVSDHGHLVTARHVIEKADKSLYAPNEIHIERPEAAIPSLAVKVSQIVKDWPYFDLALLKIDDNALEHFTQFLQIEFDTVPEGTQVYSFGYPLPQISLKGETGSMVGYHYFSPRTTSAIISSHHWYIGPVRMAGFPTHYIIDKALNYGNSGGPVIVCESGKAVSVCVKFQPVVIPQQNIEIMVPSLYGITVSLRNIQDELTSLGIVQP